MPGPYKIAIIGAGTAGLAAALLLARDGHGVTLFEAVPEPGPVGSGLLIQPTGLACLSVMGLADDLIAKGAKIDSLCGHTDQGRCIFDIAYNTLAPDYYGVGVHRGVLFSLLHEAVRGENIRIVTGTHITSVDLQGNKSSVRDQSGEVWSGFDFVIDASGRHSELRSADLGRRRKSFPYGAVWSVIDGTKLDLSRTALHQRYQTAQKMMGLLPLRHDSEGNTDQWALFWSLPDVVLSEWGTSLFETVMKEAKTLWPEAASALEVLNGPEDFAVATYDHVTVKRPFADGFIAIGDAAHCTSPQLGQGANLALADALELTMALRQADDPRMAFEKMWQQRKGATRFYQRASWLLTPFFQSDMKMAAALRDALFYPFSKSYFFDKQMIRTLAGVKTGPLASLDLARWDESNRRLADH